MNEVLTQIAKQAMVEHCISHVRLQEFAELIVKECAEVALEHDTFWGSGVDQDIKRHFGVK